MPCKDIGLLCLKKKKEVVVDLVDSLFVFLNVYWKYPLPGTLEIRQKSLCG